MLSISECTENREIHKPLLVSAAKPALVSLKDQAHVTNPLIGDLCKVPWLQMRLWTATAVPSFLRREHCLLASYDSSKDSYKKSLHVKAAKKKQTAVAYITPSHTGFL